MLTYFSKSHFPLPYNSNDHFLNYLISCLATIQLYYYVKFGSPFSFVGSAVNIFLPTKEEYPVHHGGRARSGPTAGDISPSGEEIIIKSHNDIFYWHQSLSSPLSSTLQQNYTTLPYIIEPNGEAIAWDYQTPNEEPAGYFTLSEGKNANLYYYPRNPSAAKSEACLTCRAYLLSLLFVAFLTY